ncbi:MAG: alpha/beta fold hydrolase [Gemmatimonadaceae bacterium]|nr:alpha/beta fold hydrolase [Gemmatimonadaceae bacterium]
MAARDATPRVPVTAAGRLAPAEWFPAGVAGIATRQVALPTGVRVRVLEAGPPDGPPVLLVHGWAVSAYLWRHNLLPLAAAGHRAIALDLPGHGLSDAPDADGAYTLERFAGHLSAFLDALGLERVVLAAQSMAGKIAVRVALDAPGRIARLALFGPVGFGEIPPWQVLAPVVPRLPDPLAVRLVPRRAVDFVQRRVYGKLGWFSDRDVDEYWAPTQFPAVVRAQLAMLREFDWAPWTPAALAALRTPTHVVFGTRDRTVRPVHAERLAAALPAGRLTWIVDGGHVVMEEVPTRVNAILLDGADGAR